MDKFRAVVVDDEASLCEAIKAMSKILQNAAPDMFTGILNRLTSKTTSRVERVA